jgi:hypothetical protein
MGLTAINLHFSLIRGMGIIQSKQFDGATVTQLPNRSEYYEALIYAGVAGDCMATPVKFERVTFSSFIYASLYLIYGQLLWLEKIPKRSCR